MPDRRIADFATLPEAKDDDLLLVSSEGETFNMKFGTFKEAVQGDADRAAASAAAAEASAKAAETLAGDANEKSTEALQRASSAELAATTSDQAATRAANSAASAQGAAKAAQGYSAEAQQSAAAAEEAASNAETKADEAVKAVEDLEEQLDNVSIDKDDLGLEQDAESGYVYPTYKGERSVNGIPLASSGGGGGGSAHSVRLVNGGSSLSFSVASSAQTALTVSFYEYYGSEQTTALGNLSVYYKLSTETEYKELTSKSGVAQGEPVSFDITSVLSAGYTTNVKIVAVGGESSLEKSLTFTVKCVEAYIESLTPAFPSDSLSTSVFTGNTTLTYQCVGKGLAKVVYFYIDGVLYDTVDVGTSNKVALTEAINLVGKYAYGVHDLMYYFETADGARSNVLHNIILYDNGSSSAPMIGVSKDLTAVDYGDEIGVDWVVYTPGQETTDTVKIRLYAVEDGEQVEYASSELVDVENQTVKTWSTSEYPASGTAFVELSSGSTVVTLEITINAGSSEYNIEPVETGLVYEYESSGHSNNDSDRAEYGFDYTDSTGTATKIKAVNTGFNYASNGYISTDNGVALRISGAAKHTIELPIFQTSYTDEDGQTVRLESATGAAVTTNGRTIEFVFTVREVTNRNAEIIKCMANDVGFVVTPQVCYLLSANGAKVQLDSTGFIENEENIAASYLQPNKRIHLAFVIEAVAPDGRQCISIYLNGKYAKSIPYDENDRFTQGSYIVIGNNTCIVDLYGVRLYNRGLKEAEARQNAIAAMPTIKERLAVAADNDILTDDGDVDYSKAIKKYTCLKVTGELSNYKSQRKYGGLVLTKPDGNGGYVTEFSLLGQDSDGQWYCSSKVQGTSSQKFMRKNYKFYLADASGKVKYSLKGRDAQGNALSIPESTLCYKIDYMSTDHANTLNANVADTMFTDLSVAQQEDSRHQNTIYGFRCLLFLEDPETGVITFAGDGMLNNDKGNTKTFGLECAGDTGNNTTRQKWEFLNNTHDICLFQSDRLMQVTDTSASIYNKSVVGALESCYPDQGDLKDAGIEPNYDYIQVLFTWVLRRANFWTASTAVLSEPYTYNGKSYYTEREYRKAIFINEFDKHFNRNRALTYYAFIEFTALADNRAKNMFLRCENVKAENLVFTDPSVTALSDIIDTSTGEVDFEKIDWENSTFALWLTDLYDLDSCFGAENSGYLRVPYYAEWDYQLNGSYQFNGYQSYFWLMFEEAMAADIKTKVQELATNGLNYENFYRTHITESTEMMCAAVVNRDMSYKYHDPWTEGYWDYSVSETDPTFIQTSQYKYIQRGDRIYQKGDFMYSRSHMIYSKYQTAQFLNDNINFRAGVDVAQADTGITLEAMQALYLAVKYGDSGSVYVTNGKVFAENRTTLKNTGNVGASDTVYLYSASDLTDIGDISAFRPYEVQLAKATRLKKLIIGSTASGYANGRLSALDLSACALLTEINVSGCVSLTGTLDLTKNGLIEKVYAKNSGIAFVSLPNGGLLSVLHLPAVTNLTAQNQTGLTEFSCESYENINTLRVENTPIIPALDIIKDRIAQFTGGIRIIGVNADLGDDTTVLEQLVSTAAQGKYLNNNGVLSDDKTAYPHITGTVKISALGSALYAQLQACYPDLNIEYQQIIQQYTVTFVNYDGKVLHTQYILSGSGAVDPVEEGYISTPTRESSASTVYTYNGWDKGFASISTNTTIVATYSETPRTYTVTWKNIDGSILDTQTKEYGTEAVYSGETPYYRQYEGVFAYYLFREWDKCTGCVVEDMTVTAIYDNISALPAVGTDLSAMSAVQIYGLRQAAVAGLAKMSDYAVLKDRTPIKMGYIPNYGNVNSKVVAEDKVFDGLTYEDTGIQLLKDDSSWTIVVDCTFKDATNDQVMVGCMDESSFNGFQCRYNSGPSLRWGVNSLGTNRGVNREILVLRHVKGELTATAYASRCYENAIGYSVINKSVATNTTATLTLGANKNEDGTITNYAKGVLHLCKIYYGDIGDAECRKIVAWPGKVYDLEVASVGGAYTMEGGGKTSLDFIFASSLGTTKQMNTSNVTTGGWEAMPLRAWLNGRFYDALPIQWRQIIKPITVQQTAGDASTELQACVDKVTLPNYREMSGTTDEPWVYSGNHITYFTSNQSRIAFRGVTIPQDATFYTQSNDPTSVTGHSVKEGDVWVDTGNNSIGKIWHEGEWLSARNYWLRDASTGSTTNFAFVYTSGGAYGSGYNASNSFAVRPRFSI